MRRHLTNTEMTRLREALERDGIEITSVHDLAWRRGWLLPPFHFLPTDFKSPAHLLMATALPLSVTVPEFMAVILAITIAAAAIWVFDSPEMRLALGPQKRMVMITTILGAVFYGWYRWAPPQQWPTIAHLLTILYIAAIVIGMVVVRNVVSFIRRGKRRERRRWQTYVEQVISVEAF